MSVQSRLRNFIDDPARALQNTKSRIREKVRRQTSRVNPTPILVFGNQKSGTSVITALLGEATEHSYTIDIFCFYGDATKQLLTGTRDFEAFVQEARYYFSKDIVKEPSFIAFYDELLDRFPDAKRVFILRHPVDNVRSILNRLDLPGHLDQLDSNHWKQVDDISSNWKLILEGTLFGHEGQNYIETLALRWRQAAQLYRQHEDDFALIKYEDFNAGKKHAIHRLAAQLGLEVTNSIEDLVDVQYQPKGQADVTPEAFFGARNLATIERVVRNEMKALDYA